MSCAPIVRQTRDLDCFERAFPSHCLTSTTTNRKKNCQARRLQCGLVQSFPEGPWSSGNNVSLLEPNACKSLLTVSCSEEGKSVKKFVNALARLSSHHDPTAHTFQTTP